LDHQSFLPESWCEDSAAGQERRAEAHIPKPSVSRPSPRIAQRLVRRTVVSDVVKLDWITADEEYGRSGDFLDELEKRFHTFAGTPYVVQQPGIHLPVLADRIRGLPRLSKQKLQIFMHDRIRIYILFILEL
jgi:hypothetical protein